MRRNRIILHPNLGTYIVHKNIPLMSIDIILHTLTSSTLKYPGNLLNKKDARTIVINFTFLNKNRYPHNILTNKKIS